MMIIIMFRYHVKMKKHVFVLATIHENLSCIVHLAIATAMLCFCLVILQRFSVRMNVNVFCCQLQKLLFSATLSQNPEKLQQLNLFLPRLFTAVVSHPPTAQPADNGERGTEY